MLLYIIIDPSSINKEVKKNVAYRQGLESVLTLIIKQNGILGLDIEKTISKKIIENINIHLQGTHGKKISTLFEELLKGELYNRRYVYLPIRDEKLLDIDNYIKMCQKGDFDIIFIDEDDKEYYSRFDKTLYFNEYNDSECKLNIKAREFRDRGISIFEKSNKKEIKEIFQRISSKTKKIQFYDYIIGKVDPYGLERWYDGFEFILNGWKDVSPLAKKGKKINVEIITKVFKFDKYKKQTFTRIKTIIKKLEEKYGRLCEFKLIMKLDQKNEFRARYMVTDQVVVEVRKGFDLFKTSQKNQFVSNHLRWMNDTNEILMINNIKDFKKEVIV